MAHLLRLLLLLRAGERERLRERDLGCGEGGQEARERSAAPRKPEEHEVTACDGQCTVGVRCMLP